MKLMHCRYDSLHCDSQWACYCCLEENRPGPTPKSGVQREVGRVGRWGVYKCGNEETEDEGGSQLSPYS